MSWTDERIDRLKELWTQGNTASQIAEELGGVSRNAVIGKAHRLGLQARPSPVKANDPAPAAAVAPPPTPIEEAPAPAAAAAPEPLAPEPAPVVEAAPADEPEAAPWEAQAETGDEDEEEDAAPAAPPPPPPPLIRSIGPGGFLRQAPGEQQSPIPPAPPRRLVPAKPSPEIADKTSLLDLNERICKWPIGHPGEPDFHFCGAQANPGFPYCVQHCGVAYQAQLPRRDRRPPPPLPFGGPRIR
ncbi:MAG TPA: GcrA family cell cycle regulator [Allosphingosinicella sp.]|jgi:GcrA cell cycle regulator